MGEGLNKEQSAKSNTSSKFATEYLFGHPLINKPQLVYLLKNGEEINIVERSLYHNDPSYTQLGSIPLKSILSIDVEDHSVIEKKFSMGKYLLMGGYALAFPKQDKVDKAYLVIRWRIEHLESEAIFMNTGDDAAKNMQQARHVFLHWAATAKQ